MEKMKLISNEKLDSNILKIESLFPNCITYVKNESNAIVKTINFEMLRQELGDELADGLQERFQINWPGKRQSLVNANSSIAKTLRPNKKSSINFEKTRNIFIEGDNLDALKLLQENYLSKIKLIYIDPPYNTGNDFIYADNFYEEYDEFLIRSKQRTVDGKRLVTNTEGRGRFHSDWLSMMYPRLKLSRNLLKNDGVIFISIDDNEVHNLRKICDEIFGESNFVGMFVREAIKGGSQSKFFRTSHDNILVYGKNINDLEFGGFKKKDMELQLNDERGPYAKGRELNKWGAGSRRQDAPSMWYPIKGPAGEDIYPIRNDGSEGRWRFGKESMKQLLADNNAIFEKRDNGSWVVYEKLRGNKSDITQFSSILKDKYLNAKATEELKDLFKHERAIFDFAKPTDLIKDLLILAKTGDDDVILDFFAGSGSTGHAVLRQNAEDGMNRKFILVQLSEEIAEDAEAHIMGYKTIPQVSIERLNRAGDKVKNDAANIEWDGDIGLRCFFIDSSNMSDIYYNPDAVSQDLLSDQTDNVKADRTPEDLLFQVLLDWGVDLSLPIQKESVQGKDVYLVDQNALAACFDSNGGIDEEFVKELAMKQPLRVVFRDAGFKSDSEKINVEQIFKLVSPSTEVKCI